MLRINGNNLPYDFTNRDSLPRADRGKQTFIIREGTELEQVKKHFGRNNTVCLKVFLVPYKENETIHDYYWGTDWRHLGMDRTEEICKASKLWETTVIQNLLWLVGFAPRVYGLLEIEKDGKVFPAQLVEYVEGEWAKSTGWIHQRREEIEKYLEQFGCVPWHKEQAGVQDYKDELIIDPQGARFTEKTKEKIREYVKQGKYGDGVYQSVPELDIGAHPRDTQKRIEQMKLDEIDFKGKDVLDVGCNIGMFCNYAASGGARDIHGLDAVPQIKAAQVLSFYLGNHNIDYLAIDVTKHERLPEPYFDITFFLSMNVHVDFPEWVADTTRELMIFEENAKGGHYQTDYWIKHLSNYFRKVEHIGFTTDHNPDQPKPVLYCWK